MAPRHRTAPAASMDGGENPGGRLAKFLEHAKARFLSTLSTFGGGMGLFSSVSAVRLHESGSSITVLDGFSPSTHSVFPLSVALQARPPVVYRCAFAVLLRGTLSCAAPGLAVPPPSRAPTAPAPVPPVLLFRASTNGRAALPVSPCLPASSSPSPRLPRHPLFPPSSPPQIGLTPPNFALWRHSLPPCLV